MTKKILNFSFFFLLGYLDCCRNASFFYQFQKEQNEIDTQNPQNQEECVCQECPEIVCPKIQSYPSEDSRAQCTQQLEKLNIVISKKISFET